MRAGATTPQSFPLTFQFDVYTTHTHIHLTNKHTLHTLHTHADLAHQMQQSLAQPRPVWSCSSSQLKHTPRRPNLAARAAARTQASASASSAVPATLDLAQRWRQGVASGLAAAAILLSGATCSSALAAEINLQADPVVRLVPCHQPGS